MDPGERVAVAAGQHGGAPGLLGVQERQHVPEDAIGEDSQAVLRLSGIHGVVVGTSTMDRSNCGHQNCFLLLFYNETDLLVRDGDDPWLHA